MLVVACVLAALALAERDVAGVKRGFVAQGRVFRDTCRAGFETPASTYIRGEVECRSKVIGTTICSFELVSHTRQSGDTFLPTADGGTVQPPRLTAR
uniref:Uncharacterized protein n=1 Tax=Musa acuminata subsp. malaccensis TaxID=214687 RepID=A0A804I0Y9_MUSAM